MEQQEAAIAEARPTSVFAQVNGLKLHYLDWGGRSVAGPAFHKPRSEQATHTILLCRGGSAHFIGGTRSHRN
jgi:hypothetical protein